MGIFFNYDFVLVVLHQLVARDLALSSQDTP